MKGKGTRLRVLGGTIASGALVLGWAAYRRDLDVAARRISTGSWTVATPIGPVEFADAGEGPAALVIHGAGGGWDQGLDLARSFLGDGHRVIAPSRFGYLGTPMPKDASAEAQADAYRYVLDALGIGKVVVLGVSAGGPSAMQFCLRHPDRCSALVLGVPLAWAPGHEGGRPLSPFAAKALEVLVGSDLVFWSAMKVAHGAMVKMILGTPVEVYRNASDEDRRAADAVLSAILPVSRRIAGLRNDGNVATTLTRYPLEDLRLPALVISAKDDLYGTFEPSRYIAEQLHAKFVAFTDGGHMLLGHEQEMRTRVRKFLESAGESKRAAS